MSCAGVLWKDVCLMCVCFGVGMACDDMSVFGSLSGGMVCQQGSGDFLVVEMRLS